MNKKEFQRPADRFRPMPFWFWNHYLDDSVLKQQIAEMKKQGLSAFFIHARHGLNIPYLDGDWMRKCRLAAAEAKRLGMQAWLYDEDNWPSGTTGGRVLREHPEYRASFLTAREITLSGPQEFTGRIEPDDGIILLTARRSDRRGQPTAPPDAVDLHAFLAGNALKWRAPAGNWKIIVITRTFYRGLVWGGEEKNLRRGYLDVLSHDAVRRFIETTHQAYVEHLRDYMPDTIPGFFVDEPSMNYSNTNDYNWNRTRMKAVPWTPELEKEFKRVAGYDLRPVLPALFYDTGETTARIRCDYYETVTGLYCRNFFKQIRDYCRKHRLLSIGHVIAEGELFMQIRNQGDYFRVTEHMDYAGCDQLADQTWPNGLFHTSNLAAPKFASSAGHLLGKPRVASESYGLTSGWALTLKTLKKLTDWQIALGVNCFIPHALHHSIFGFRKWECPPSHYQATFWKYYRLYVDYTARLCAVFSGGRHVAQVAVLSPVKSIWAEMDPDDNSLINEICGEFDRISVSLLRHHHDFDYLNEEILQRAVVRDGRLTFFDANHRVAEEFEALILPSATTISRATLEKIAEFARQGGLVVATMRLPEASVEAGRDSGLKEAAARIFARKTCYLLKGSADAREGALIELLARHLKPDVVIRDRRGTTGEIIHLHYRKEEQDFYYLVNTAEQNIRGAEVRLSQTGTVELWDPAGGRTTPCPGVETDGSLRLKLSFAPLQSRLLAVSARHPVSRNIRLPGARPAPHPVFTCEVKGPWRFSTLKANALPLKRWDYVTTTRVTPTSRFALAIHRYKTNFTLRDMPVSLRLLLDGLLIDRVHYACPALRESTDHGIRVFINGQNAAGWRDGTYLDHYIKEVDIRKFAKKGRNIITVETISELFEAPNLTDPFILVGDFRIRFRGTRPVIVRENQLLRTGSWAAQGYPYYSGIASYWTTVTIPRSAPPGRAILTLGNIADMAEVQVNGHGVKILPWPPYEADISRFLKPGANEITLLITNSLQNLLVGEKKPSGLLGKVLIHFYE